MFYTGSFGVWLLPVLVVILIVALVALFTRRTLADGTSAFTPRRLVEAYVFAVVLVAMVLVSTGLADLVRAAIARGVGLESSYRPEPVHEKDRKPGEEPEYEYDARAPRRDMLSGAAQLGVGLIVGVLHFLGLRRLARTESLFLSPVYRLFLIVSLVFYTYAVLIFAVGTVKDFLIFRYVPPRATPQPWFERPLPGDQLAGLIGYLPLWGLLVVLLFRYARPRNAPA